MNALDLRLPRAPAADELVLYHILHPTRKEWDQWTSDYKSALDCYEQYTERYGRAHLHLEHVHPGQYEAYCLRRSDKRAGT
jgi:hypothetical protein